MFLIESICNRHFRLTCSCAVLFLPFINIITSTRQLCIFISLGKEAQGS